MRQRRARLEDGKFERERRTKYRGAARISLDLLVFPNDHSTKLDPKNVERLKEAYRHEGCRREPVRNHVLALVDQSVLDAASALSGISAAALLTPAAGAYPQLQFRDGQQLTCLHGQHRIQAGREFLSPQDKWWIVDLYLTGEHARLSNGALLTWVCSDLSSDVQRTLIEEYSNENAPSDGEIYCRIRQYHYQRNYSFESRWWARLRGCRARNLKGLLKHTELAAAFDALLDVSGLWGGMQLTTLHKIMALKSDEEILNYLEHIRQFWHKLVDGDVGAMQKIDDHTIQVLELRAPGPSTRDADEILAQLEAGKIFNAFSVEERTNLFCRLRQFKSLIPSLTTFFRSLPYWEACVGSMRHLVDLSPRDTISSSFERQFTGVNQQNDQVQIQIAESEFAAIPGSQGDQIELGYRQIVAFAMRHFLNIPQEPINHNVTARARVTADKAVLHRFGALAIHLGFESPKIHALLRDADMTDLPTMSTSTRPLLVTSGPGEKLRRRCGLPAQDTFREDRDSLFLHHFHDHPNDQGEGITSFFVLRATYFAFLQPQNSEALSMLARNTLTLTHRANNHIEEPSPEELNEALNERQRQERGREEREEVRREEARGEEARREEERQEEARREEAGREEARRREERLEEEWREDAGHAKDMVCIHFKIRENKVWRVVQSLWVERSDPSEVIRVAKKNMRKGLRIFDTNMQLLAPDDCFDAVTADGTNTIVLVPQMQLEIDDQMLDSANVLAYTAIVDTERAKRQAR